MDLSASCGAVHVLVLPMPAQGHINPMLLFSKQLAARGVIVTFLLPDQVRRRMLETASHPSPEEEEEEEGEAEEESVCDVPKRSDIQFEVMPDGSAEPLPGTHPDCNPLTNLIAILEGVESQQGVIEEMVVRSRATPHPITCIISDSFFPWTCPIAAKLGIQRVLFWTSNGATLATSLAMQNAKLKPTDMSNGEMVPGIPMVLSELFPYLPPQEPEVMERLIGRLNGLRDTTCILVNTFKELEGWSLDSSALCEAKVYDIGPLVPLGNRNAALRVNFYKEEDSCIAWLDKQAPSSVLYVSFGSVASLPPQELEELALGIEESKHPFLWVSRHSEHLFPDGFLNRTSDRGLVVQWAPQIKVLGHVAVGGFLTHCGWNSILESIHMGVRMLCYPLIHDQHLNALLITKVWKLGIGLSKEGGRQEIQRGVSSILSSEELHLKLSTWSGASHRALQQGGSSYLAIESFIDTLKSSSS